MDPDIKIEEIELSHQKLQPFLVKTPVLPLKIAEDDDFKSVEAKLELFQFAKSFKTRGTLLAMLDLDQESKERGVVACSGGNFAIAVAYVSKKLRIDATVVMPKTASPIRQKTCRDFGANVVLADRIEDVFHEAQKIANHQGRTFLHPFEGKAMTLGAATMAYEFFHQSPGLEVVIAAIGGGGMASGVALAFKLLNPNIRVIGVEPRGANSMHLSFASGKTEKLKQVDTIADSLGSPLTEPYSFRLCHQYLDELVYVEESEMKETMKSLFYDYGLVVEPACAAGLASAHAALKQKLQHKKVGLFFCGSNIDLDRFRELTHI